MIPSYFIKINKIPVTVNGKLDRRALPEPKFNVNGDDEYVAPETYIEKTICRIYSIIFNISESKIGKTSDFFELVSSWGFGLKITRSTQRLNYNLKKVRK